METLALLDATLYDPVHNPLEKSHELIMIHTQFLDSNCDL